MAARKRKRVPKKSSSEWKGWAVLLSALQLLRLIAKHFWPA